ncbi:MAG: DUF2723 domain-containing protein [Rubrobacter sp.]|nr:DUF2723 domain-containing protein [Rubrobacter sp.]
MSGPWRKAPGKTPERRPEKAGAAFGAGSLALLVYLATLSPTVASNDAARFQIAAPLLGLGHPTGYPTFILLGKLFTFLPVGDVAYRVTLMVAVFGAVSVTLMVLVALELGARTLPALGAGLLLGFTATFWSQAVFAEVYTLHAAFLLGVTYLLLLWRRTGGGGYLLAAALLYGLSLGNNAGMVLLAPAYAVLLFWGRHRELPARRLLGVGGSFLVGLSVYLYVPLRGFAGAWHNYGDPVNDWMDAWRLISAARFQELMVSSPLELLESAGLFLWRFSEQAAHPAGLLLAAVLLAGGVYGIRVVLRRDPAVGLALALGAGCTLAYALSYQIADIEVYYIPVYLFLILGSAVAAGALAGRGRLTALMLAAPLLAAGIALAVNYSVEDQSDNFADRERAEALFERLPEEAIVYGKVQVLPPAYLKNVEGERGDVTLRWLDGGTLDRNIADDVESGRPVYFISDPRYNEDYLRGASAYADPRFEGELIRLVPA